MSTKATMDRYYVMEAYVNIMKGNLKQLEITHSRLVQILSIVIYLLIFQRSEYAPALLAIAIIKFMMSKDT